MRWVSMFIVWFVPVAANATVLANWSIEQVVGHADRVVVGVVVEQHATRSPGPRTDTVIRVERVLFGPSAETITVRQYGGRFGDRLLRIPGDAPLRIGQRLLVITHTGRDGREYLVGMSLGAYQVDGDSLVQSIDVPVLDADGQLRPPPGVRTLRLGDVEAAIRRRR